MAYDKPSEYIRYTGTIPDCGHSPALEKILLTPEYINKKMDEGSDPVELSIEKWEKIRQAYEFIATEGFKFFYYGIIYHYCRSDTCALCIMALREYKKEFGVQKYHGDKCIKCPLSSIEPCYEINSVYSNITYLLGYRPPEYQVPQPVLQVDDMDEKEIFSMLGQNIDLMIERLKRLL